MIKVNQIPKLDLIKNKIGFFMFDLETAETVVINCTEDLKIEFLCHSDGELDNDGHNLLVMIDNAEYKQAYMFMSHIDYSDFVEDFYGATNND